MEHNPESPAAIPGSVEALPLGSIPDSELDYSWASIVAALDTDGADHGGYGSDGVRASDDTAEDFGVPRRHMDTNDPDATIEDFGVPLYGGGADVDHEGTAIISPERQACYDLETLADEILDRVGVRPTTPGDVARLKEFYELGEGDVIEARAFSPVTNESVARIMCADGLVMYRHDSYWYGAREEGSFVSVWAKDGDGMITARLAYSYDSAEGSYSDDAEVGADEMEDIVRSLQSAFPNSGRSKIYPPEVHLAGRRMHDILGSNALRAGFSIRRPYGAAEGPLVFYDDVHAPDEEDSEDDESSLG